MAERGRLRVGLADHSRAGATEPWSHSCFFIPRRPQAPGLDSGHPQGARREECSRPAGLPGAPETLPISPPGPSTSTRRPLASRSRPPTPLTPATEAAGTCHEVRKRFWSATGQLGSVALSLSAPRTLPHSRAKAQGPLLLRKWAASTSCGHHPARRPVAGEPPVAMRSGVSSGEWVLLAERVSCPGF